jgi:hypothetical protein
MPIPSIHAGENTRTNPLLAPLAARITGRTDFLAHSGQFPIQADATEVPHSMHHS